MKMKMGGIGMGAGIAVWAGAIVSGLVLAPKPIRPYENRMGAERETSRQNTKTKVDIFAEPRLVGTGGRLGLGEEGYLEVMSIGEKSAKVRISVKGNALYPNPIKHRLESGRDYEIEIAYGQGATLIFNSDTASVLPKKIVLPKDQLLLKMGQVWVGIQ